MSNQLNSNNNDNINDRIKSLNMFEKKLNIIEVELDDEERILRELQEKRYLKTKCKCLPMNIEKFIDIEYRNVVWKMYYLFVFNSMVLILNLLGIIIGLNDKINTKYSIFIGLIYVVIGIPFSWNLWYKKFYISILKRSSTTFMMFNINFIIHIFFVGIMAIGFNVLDSIGLLITIKSIQNNLKCKYYFISCTILWFINLLFSLFIMKKALRVNATIQYKKIMNNYNQNSYKEPQLIL